LAADSSADPNEREGDDVLRKLEDYESEMFFCGRCSYCKWVNAPDLKSHRFSGICPSIRDGSFHAYSGGGRVNVANSYLKGRLALTDKMMDVIYRCTMCGACDTNCRVVLGNMLSVNEILHALRVRCAADGRILPRHAAMMDKLRKEDNWFGAARIGRGNWAQGLGLRDAAEEKVDVLLHVGCRLSYDQDLRHVARGYATLLGKTGVDFGIALTQETCCGLRAFEIGFPDEMEKCARDMVRRIAASGATKLVAVCSDCYSAFKYYYPWVGVKLDIEILHITEYLDGLLREGKLKLTKEVRKKVTYHDPCHLGRLGEVYQPWEGEWKEVLGHMLVSEPTKPVRAGENGVYEPPRNILRHIRGLELVEMERNRLNSWCCGAGAGAFEAFPDFTYRTALERLEEAKATGAEALVTACPWCERVFRDTVKQSGSKLRVYDIIELIGRAR